MHKKVLDEILDKVVSFSKGIFKDKLKDIILFGSYARGDYTDGPTLIY